MITIRKKISVSLVTDGDKQDRSRCEASRVMVTVKNGFVIPKDKSNIYPRTKLYKEHASVYSLSLFVVFSYQ